MKRALMYLKKCMLFPAAVLVALGRTISRKTKRVVMANFIVVMFVISLVFGGITVKVFSEDEANTIEEDAIDSAVETGIEASDTEASKAEISGTEAPDTEMVSGEASGTKASDTKASDTIASAEKIPGGEDIDTKASNMGDSDTKAADTEAAGTEASKAEVSGAEVSDTEMASGEASGTKASDTEASGTAGSPDTEAAGPKASDTKASDTKSSDTKASDTEAPKTSEADQPQKPSQQDKASVDSSDKADKTADKEAEGDASSYPITKEIIREIYFLMLSGEGESDTDSSDIEEEELDEFDAPDVDMVVEADGYTSIYDGWEHSIALTVTAPPSGATISYATSETGEYDAQLPMFSAAGDHTVYYKVTADGYNTCTGSANVTISKRDLVITPDEDQKKEYGDEDAVPFTYEAEGLLAGDTLEGGLGREAGEEVGSYEYTLGTLSNDNYNISLSDESPTYDIVQKPLASLTIIQDEKTYTYDGANHSPAIEVTDGGKPLVEGVDYNISGSLSESEAGDYVIFIEGCGNYLGFYAVEYKIEGPPQEEKVDNSILEPKAAEPATTEATTAATTAEVASTTTEQKSTLKEIVVENLVTAKKTEKTTEESAKKKTTAKKNSSTKDLAKADVSGESGGSDVKSAVKTDVQTGDKAPVEFLWMLVILSGVMLMILNIMDVKYIDSDREEE